MKEFKQLLEIADRLLGPGGCPWDREQTMFTLQPYLLEEMHELIEAIDSLDSVKILEELGDVLYALIFVAKIAETEGRFKINEAIQAVSEKLVRRHPHVFGEATVASADEVVQKWDEIKSKEKSQQERKKIFDGIPPTLPTLPRAQKMASRLRKKRESIKEGECTFQTEEELSAKIWLLISEAERKGIDVESALRRKLGKIEESAGE